MDDKNLKQIEKVVEKAVRSGFAEVWEGNLEPALEQVHKEIAQLPTKTFLSDRFANLEGDLIKKLRKEDEKVNRLAKIIKDRKVLTELDIKELGNLQVFPK